MSFYWRTLFPNVWFYTCTGLNVIPDFNEMKCQWVQIYIYCAVTLLGQISTNGVHPSYSPFIAACWVSTGTDDMVVFPHPCFPTKPFHAIASRVLFQFPQNKNPRTHSLLAPCQQMLIYFSSACSLAHKRIADYRKTKQISFSPLFSALLSKGRRGLGN